MTRVLIIQARMGSTRLPEKVLASIGGEPMLARVVERASAANGIDQLVIATTTASRDDAIVALARERGWDVARGSEEDVLDRFHQVAVDRAASVVVRVTGDCPLIDPAVIDSVVQALDANGAEYASNTLELRTYPRGLDVEVMTAGALAEAWRDDADPRWREHVTPFLYRHPERFRLASVTTSPNQAAHRWSVDTPEDLQLVRKIWDALPGRSMAWQDALAVVVAHPEWAKLNAHVPQVAVP